MTLKSKKYNISKWDNCKVNYWGIPKCGNTSIKFALHECEGNKGNHPAAGVSQWVHHHNITKYIDKSQAVNNGYINFTVTRNPYDRALSMWKDFQKRNKIYLTILSDAAKNIKTLDEFLLYLDSQKDSQRNEHFRTQTSFIIDNGKLIPEFIFDINDTSSINTKFNINVPHINKIEQTIKLTKNHMDLIYKIYKSDFKFLKYYGKSNK